MFDLSMPWYIPERDGTIDDYLAMFEEGRQSSRNGKPPMFIGRKYYEQLWDKKYLNPIVSVIRVMRESGEEESYLVANREMLETAPNGEKAYRLTEILGENGPIWSVGNLRAPRR